MATFEWPWQYKFPPFFTLQPNLETRQKQLQAWCSLVLSYHKHKKIFSLDVTEAQSSPLFHNTQIDRKLPVDAVHIVLEELRKKGNLEWADKSRRRCLIMWRTPEEWGSLLYQWASTNGLLNTVCTLYELVSGDDTSKEELCHPEIGGKQICRKCRKMVDSLESLFLHHPLFVPPQKRKATVNSIDDNDDDHLPRDSGETNSPDEITLQEFHGLDMMLLKRSLKTLEAQRKAELISFDGNEGVKFF